jgi:hypothetical protein
MEIDKLVDEYVSGNGSSSKSTASTAKNSFKRLEKVLEKPTEDMTVEDFEDSDGLLDTLLDKYSNNTTIQTLLFIKFLLRKLEAPEKLIEEYHEYMLELVAERNDQENSQRKNPAEEALGEDFDYGKMREKFVKEVEEMPKDPSFSMSRAMMMLGLFLLQPPTRIGNYLDMIIRKPGQRLKKDTNYLIVSPDGNYKFVFQNYKTAKNLGKIELPVKNETLKHLIDTYLERHPDYKSKKVSEFIVNPNGKSVSQSNFTQILKSITKKIYGVPGSTNLFRHSFLSWFLSQNPTIEEKKKITRLIGQNLHASRAEKYQRHDEDRESIMPEYDDL